MARGNFLGVYGHTNVDHITLVSGFPPLNQSVQIERFRHMWGGTAANIAAVAARQGVPASLASFVGGNFPDQFHDHLDSLGVDLHDLTVVEGDPTPECYIFSDGDEHQMAFVIQGPMERADRLELQRHTLETSEVVHIATGNPAYHMEVAKRAREAGRTVCFDPGQELHFKWDPERFCSMLELADVLFLNEAELARAYEYTGLSSTEDLLGRVGTIILTRGGAGSVLMDGEGVIEVPVVEAARVEDTTGAGDAFRGGYYSGLHRGLGRRDRMLLAAATASFVVERQGPQTNMPTFEEAWGRAERAGAGRE